MGPVGDAVFVVIVIRQVHVFAAPRHHPLAVLSSCPWPSSPSGGVKQQPLYFAASPRKFQICRFGPARPFLHVPSLKIESLINLKWTLHITVGVFPTVLDLSPNCCHEMLICCNQVIIEIVV